MFPHVACLGLNSYEMRCDRTAVGNVGGYVRSDVNESVKEHPQGAPQAMCVCGGGGIKRCGEAIKQCYVLMFSLIMSSSACLAGNKS